MLSASRDSFSFSLLISASFMYVSGLIALAKNVGTVLTKSGQTVCSCFTSDFRRSAFGLPHLVDYRFCHIQTLPCRGLLHLFLVSSGPSL